MAPDGEPSSDTKLLSGILTIYNQPPLVYEFLGYLPYYDTL